LGNDPSPYIDAGLKLTTNEEANDYSKIIDFIHFLNQQDRSDFDAEFKKRFDVENYLKILAVEKFIRSWDNYWAGGNNFYIYEHPDGQYRWIPWDINETFQDLRNLSWTTWLDGYWVPTKQMDERPLIAAIFRNEQLQQDYLELGCELIHEKLTIQNLSARVVFWHNLVAEAYRSDPNKINGFDEFEKSLTEEHTDQVPLFNTPYAVRIHYPGVFPLIQKQREWVAHQLKGWEVDCDVEIPSIPLQLYPNPGNAYFRIQLPRNQLGQVARMGIYTGNGVRVKCFPWMLITEDQLTVSWDGEEPGVYWIGYEGMDGSRGWGKWMCIRP
jgi:hypothetical protein